MHDSIAYKITPKQKVLKQLSNIIALSSEAAMDDVPHPSPAM